MQAKLRHAVPDHVYALNERDQHLAESCIPDKSCPQQSQPGLSGAVPWRIGIRNVLRIGGDQHDLERPVRSFFQPLHQHHGHQQPIVHGSAEIGIARAVNGTARAVIGDVNECVYYGCFGQQLVDALCEPRCIHGYGELVKCDARHGGVVGPRNGNRMSIGLVVPGQTETHSGSAADNQKALFHKTVSTRV